MKSEHSKAFIISFIITLVSLLLTGIGAFPVIQSALLPKVELKIDNAPSKGYSKFNFIFNTNKEILNSILLLDIDYDSLIVIKNHQAYCKTPSIINKLPNSSNTAKISFVDSFLPVSDKRAITFYLYSAQNINLSELQKRVFIKFDNVEYLPVYSDSYNMFLVLLPLGILLLSFPFLFTFFVKNKNNKINFYNQQITEMEASNGILKKDNIELKKEIGTIYQQLGDKEKTLKITLSNLDNLKKRLLEETGSVNVALSIADQIEENIIKKGQKNILSTDSLQSKDYIPLGLFLTWSIIARLKLQGRELGKIYKRSETYCSINKFYTEESPEIFDEINNAIDLAKTNFLNASNNLGGFDEKVKSIFHNSKINDTFIITKILIGNPIDLLNNDLAALINFYELFEIPLFFVNIDEIITNSISWYKGHQSDLLIIGDRFIQGYPPSSRITWPLTNTFQPRPEDMFYELLTRPELNTMLAFDALQLVKFNKSYGATRS